MLKKYLFITLIILVLSFLIFNAVCAQRPSSFGEGLNKTAEDIQDIDQETSLSDYLVFATQALLSFIGVAFVALLIYGGLTYMTAQGVEERIVKSKKIIIQAVVGIVLIGAGHAITLFIASQIEQPGEGYQTPYSEECLNPYEYGYFSIYCCEYRYQRSGEIHIECCEQSPFYNAHEADCALKLGGTGND